jgi:hypothetical protein
MIVADDSRHDYVLGGELNIAEGTLTETRQLQADQETACRYGSARIASQSFHL